MALSADGIEEQVGQSLLGREAFSSSSSHIPGGSHLDLPPSSTSPKGSGLVAVTEVQVSKEAEIQGLIDELGDTYNDPLSRGSLVQRKQMITKREAVVLKLAKLLKDEPPLKHLTKKTGRRKNTCALRTAIEFGDHDTIQLIFKHLKLDMEGGFRLTPNLNIPYPNLILLTISGPMLVQYGLPKKFPTRFRFWYERGSFQDDFLQNPPVIQFDPSRMLRPFLEAGICLDLEAANPMRGQDALTCVNRMMSNPQDFLFFNGDRIVSTFAEGKKREGYIILNTKIRNDVGDQIPAVVHLDLRRCEQLIQEALFKRNPGLAEHNQGRRHSFELKVAREERQALKVEFQQVKETLEFIVKKYGQMMLVSGVDSKAFHEKRIIGEHQALQSFYLTLRQYLNQSFLAAQSLASGMVAREKSETLDYVGMAVETFCNDIPIPGSAIVGKALMLALQAGEHVKHKRAINAFAQVAPDAMEFAKLAEMFARKITLQKKETLLSIDDQGFVETGLKRFVKNAKKVAKGLEVRDSVTPVVFEAQEMATFIVSQTMQGKIKVTLGEGEATCAQWVAIGRTRLQPRTSKPLPPHASRLPTKRKTKRWFPKWNRS